MRPILLFLSLWLVLASPGQSIYKAEYFFDNDPGYGHGTSVATAPGQLVEMNFNANTSGLAPGIHTLFVRVKSGKWSQVLTRLIGISADAGISRAEYFFDNDPGVGQGISIPVTPGKVVDLNFNANTSGLAPGMHTLYVRVKTGSWGQTYSRLIGINADTGITRAEYFFNTDPGFGQGTPIAIIPGKVVDLNFNANATGLSYGIHTLYVRVKSGNWSQAHSRLVGISPDIGITKAEYFVGPDPGFGNGTPIAVVPGNLVTLDFNIQNPNPGNGMSHIYVRTYAGRWGQTFIHEYCRNAIPDFSTDVAQLGNPTTFTNLSQQTNDSTQFFWDVNGDGTWDHTGGDNFMYLYTAPGSYNAKLQVVSGTGCSDFIIKEVLVYACMAPTALTATNITYQSAELSWTPGTFGNQWDIIYGPHGFNPVLGGTLIQGVTTRPYTLNGLTPLTSYDYYVRTVCSGENSAWSGPKNFTTVAYICPPPWTISPYYQYNMQVIGKISFGGIQSLNPNDKVGAFVNGECRGIASPDPNTFGLVFLSIGSNQVSGELVQFKIWKVSECAECPTGQSMQFQNQLQVGNPGNPYPFACGQQQLPIAFGTGYTWFSVNVNPGSMGLNSLFAGLSPCDEDRILGQNAFAVVYNGNWVGSLSSVNPAQMYKMQLCNQQNLTISGQPVNNVPVSLGAGYTWLGYLPQGGLPINTALAGLTPAPAENNRVLGQNSFAVYYQGQWIGSLANLNPGKGYIIELSNPGTLQYPVATGKNAIFTEEELVSPTGEAPLAYQQFSMMLIAQLKLPDGNISINPADVVFAYAGNECRGMAVPVAGKNGVLFMSIGANVHTGEKIRFKAWLSEYEMLADINESVVFESLKKAGTMETPILLTINGITGMDKHPEDGVYIGEPYPNPFSESTSIPYRLNFPASVKLTLCNSQSQILRIIDFGYLDSGLHSATISRNDLPAGVYFYRMEVFNQCLSIQKNGKMVICN
jgi:hypothetical protein